MSRVNIQSIRVAWQDDFAWLFDSIQAVERDPKSVLREPQTFLENVRGAAQRSLEQRFGQPGIIPFMGAVSSLAKISDREWNQAIRTFARQLRARRASAAVDAAGRELLALAEDAHNRVKHSPILAMPDPASSALAVLSAIARLSEVNNTHGENRARLLLCAVSEVVEGVYGEYLRNLYKLVHFARGTSVPRMPTLGGLVANLREPLRSYPSLIHANAVHIRNAAAHRRWKYLPQSHSVEMHEMGNRWQLTITVEALEDLVNQLMALATRIYPDTISLYVLDLIANLVVPVLPALTRALVLEDWESACRLVDELGHRCEGEIDGFKAIHFSQPAQ